GRRPRASLRCLPYNALRPCPLEVYAACRHLLPSPTRRSSDLVEVVALGGHERPRGLGLFRGQTVDALHQPVERIACAHNRHARPDRKSTRLNSSHVKISYAVFCLTKKKEEDRRLAASHGRAFI